MPAEHPLTPRSCRVFLGISLISRPLREKSLNLLAMPSHQPLRVQHAGTILLLVPRRPEPPARLSRRLQPELQQPQQRTIRCQFVIGQFGVSSSLLLPLQVQFGVGQFGCHMGQFGVSSSLLLPLHQVSKLDSWEDFQDRQAMTLFTTRSTAGTTEPMSSAPRANGICSLAISPAPRHGILSRSSATA